MRWWIALLCVIFTSLTSVYAGVSDSSGYIWTPDGRYVSNMGASGEFDTARSYGMLSMGNSCTVEGRLSHPDKSKAIFLLKVTQVDGESCPNVSQIFVHIVDGYAVRALGNASKIKVTHRLQTGKVNFSGIYEF